MKLFYKQLFLLGFCLFILQSISAADQKQDECLVSSFTDPKGIQVDLYHVQGGDLKNLEDMYVVNVRAHGNKIRDRVLMKLSEENLRENFDLNIKQKIDDAILIKAKKAEKDIGFILFERVDDDAFVIGERILDSIERDDWDFYLEKMFFSIFSLCPETNKLYAMAYKRGVFDQKKLLNLGFKKSDYRKPGANPHRFAGFEYERAI